MSSKKRRSKKEDDQVSAEEGSTAAEAAEKEPAAAQHEKAEGEKAKGEKAEGEKAKGRKSKKPKPEKKKSSLPAFGFATDLLEKSDGADQAESYQAGSDAVDLDADDLEVGEIDESSPSRIFDFADQVQSRAQKSKEDEGPKARWETWMTFHLDDEVFAMPVDPVRQVVRVSHITRVPHAPKPVRGVTNLRGRVIPVIDLRMRVGLDPSEIGRQSRVVAVASRGRVLGLLVDSVHQVVHLDLNRVQPPPEDVMTIQSDYILGVYHQEDQLILLLDVDRALILREKGAA